VDEANTNLLSQLRDIHGASDPGWWPLAPGWWVLLVLTIVLLVLFLRFVINQWRVTRRRRVLLLALEGIGQEVDPTEYPREYLALMNRFFRAVALRAFPATACGRLQGDEWVQFIHSLMPDGTPSADLAVLATGPYQPEPEYDADGLYSMAKTWVSRYG
jgi:hypothetical protein